MTPIAPLIEAFLDETLARQRGVSRHTRDSYALSFQLLFMFAAKRLKVSPSALTLEQLDAGLISAFLEYLEDTRKNAPETRNVRLAAIKSFFRFLEYRQPAALEHVRRVLAIPFKKTDRRLVPYLPRKELQAVLDAPDPATRDGIRDRAMLHLAVCAGLRVSELTGVKLADIDLSSDEHSCSGQGTAGTDAPLVEDHGRSPARLARRSRTGRSTRSVRQRPGRAAEPMGLRLSAQTACSDRRSSASRPRQETHLAPRAQAHMRDDHPAGNAGHPEGVAVVGACHSDDH
jgi:site-specific recombinase XerC